MARIDDERLLALALAFLLDCKSRYVTLTSLRLRTRQSRMAAFALWYRKSRLLELVIPGVNIAAVLELYATHERLWLILKSAAKKLAGRIPACVYNFVFGETVEHECVDAWLRSVLDNYDQLREKICLLTSKRLK